MSINLIVIGLYGHAFYIMIIFLSACYLKMIHFASHVTHHLETNFQKETVFISLQKIHALSLYENSCMPRLFRRKNCAFLRSHVVPIIVLKETWLNISVGFKMLVPLKFHSRGPYSMNVEKRLNDILLLLWFAFLTWEGTGRREELCGKKGIRVSEMLSPQSYARLSVLNAFREPASDLLNCTRAFLFKPSSWSKFSNDKKQSFLLVRLFSGLSQPKG